MNMNIYGGKDFKGIQLKGGHPQNMNFKAWTRDSESRNQSRYNMMSTKTKDFIQKICYKKTASVDMTQFGFINDSKQHPVNMLLKPLREQLEKICGKTNCNMVTRKTSPIPYIVKTKPNKKPKRSCRKRKVKTADRSSKELVVRTEDLIAKRRMKKAADAAATYENSYNYKNRLQIK